jgi:hypothetical protein
MTTATTSTVTVRGRVLRVDVRPGDPAWPPLLGHGLLLRARAVHPGQWSAFAAVRRFVDTEVMADLEAIHTFEGTETMQTLIVGRDITGVGAFT